MINVCAYCRVSTDKKDQENSFENQQKYFKRELNKKNEYNLYKIYADKGLSGTSFKKREEFNNMLFEAGLDMKEIKLSSTENRINRIKTVYIPSDREPKFKYIYVKNSSRFARNIEVVSILRSLKEKNVYVCFLDLNKSTENDADEMLLQFIFSMDENESRDKSRKVRWGHLESANNNNKIHCNSRIYGFKLLKEENRLIQIPEEAKIVRKIFELYAEGNGVRKILNYLNENNIKNRSGKEFNKSTINNILQNEKYCGLNARNKWDAGTIFSKGNAKLRPRDEWIVRKNDRIEAIISEELFNKCKKIRNSKINHKKNIGVYSGRSEFSGLIQCSKCGSNYTRNIDKGKIFYNCSLKKTKGANACTVRNLYLTELEEELEKWRSWLFKKNVEMYYEEDIEFLFKYREKLNNLNKNSDDKKLIQEKESTLYIYQNKLKKLLDLYIDKNDINKEIFETKKEEINNNINNIQNEIDFLKNKENKINDYMKMLDFLEKFLDKLKKENSKELTREKLIDNIQYITVKKSTIDITFKHQLIFGMLRMIIDDNIYNKTKTTEENYIFKAIDLLREKIGKFDNVSE